MSKKKPMSPTPSVKGSGSKADRQRAGAAANPVRPQDVTPESKAPKAASGTSGSVTPAQPAQPARPPFRRPQSLNFAGVGRNDICPCGSGKRFKNCHGH